MAKYEDVKLALQGRRALKNYPFPGLDDGTEVALRLLTEGDLDSVRVAAADKCKEKRVELNMDPDFLDRCIHRFTILRAFFDTEKGDPFFKSFEEVSQLDNLLVHQLYAMYRLHQQSMDPLAHLGPEEVGAVVEHLGKSGSSVASLSLFDVPTLQSLVLSMAAMLRKTSPQHKSDTSST